MFKDKSVILIGPAPHILDRFTDTSAFDIVARVGAIFPMSPELIAATGSRCDVWYPANTYLQANPHICADTAISKIRITATGAKFIPKEQQHKVSLTGWNIPQLQAILGCNPNRGLRAMIDILKESPRSLHIIGFTFYQSEHSYYPGYTTDEFNAYSAACKGDVGSHLQAPQIRYFKKYILPHVTTDIELLEAIGKGIW